MFDYFERSFYKSTLEFDAENDETGLDVLLAIKGWVKAVEETLADSSDDGGFYEMLDEVHLESDGVTSHYISQFLDGMRYPADYCGGFLAEGGPHIISLCSIERGALDEPLRWAMEYDYKPYEAGASERVHAYCSVTSGSSWLLDVKISTYGDKRGGASDANDLVSKAVSLLIGCVSDLQPKVDGRHIVSRAIPLTTSDLSFDQSLASALGFETIQGSILDRLNIRGFGSLCDKGLA